METLEKTKLNRVQPTHELGGSYSESTPRHDNPVRFVFDNYKQLKARDHFSKLIPAELGGGRLSYSEAHTELKN